MIKGGNDGRYALENNITPTPICEKMIVLEISYIYMRNKLYLG